MATTVINARAIQDIGVDSHKTPPARLPLAQVVTEQDERTMVSFTCHDLQLYTLSDEIVDLSTSLRTRVQGQVMQDV